MKMKYSQVIWVKLKEILKMNEISRNSLYKHYDGNLYYVISLAEHRGTDNLMVVYHALYGDNYMYVSDLELFKSEFELYQD